MEDSLPPGVGANAPDEPGVNPMWHVTLSVAGEPVDKVEIKAALERLADERPFLLTGRYAETRAEVRYWEEAVDLQDAAALALRLWGEHRDSARLPAWAVVGLEVVDRETFHQRGISGELDIGLSSAGSVKPF